VTLLVAIFCVLFGLAFGSFLNVCIARLPRHESIVRPASHCPACAKPIRAWDNLPLLSWIILRGRCRNCGWPIPWRYPLVELGTAILFLLAYLTFGLTLQAAGMALLCFTLFGLAVMDAETLLLPDAFTLPGIVLGVIFSGLTGGWRAAGWSAAYAVGGAALILLIRGTYWLVRRREGMGLGDAKLFALIAAWLGPWQSLLVLFLGVVTAAVFSLLWVWLGNSQQKLPRSRDPQMPLAEKQDIGIAEEQDISHKNEPGGHISHGKEPGRHINGGKEPGRRGLQPSQNPGIRAGALAPEVEAHGPGSQQIPLGSFLCAAAIYAIFRGEQTLKWYLQFFR
jgi:leader peptidase (prepilin peptidase)/N-methyltransferase